MNNAVTAIVVTYNRKKLLEECISSILNQTVSVKKIIVINNASTDGTEKLFEPNGILNNKIIECINMKSNTGGSGGFYEGMSRVLNEKTDWAWVMDDDTIPNRDCLEKLLAAHKELNKNKDYKDGKRKISFYASSIFGASGEFMNVPNIDFSNSKNGYPSFYEHLNHALLRIKDATFVSLLISKDAILKVGLPCKDYFIWGDDGEYTLRLTKYFGEAYMVGDSIAIHKRIGAKKLDVSNFDDTQRIKMYHYYIRNNIINALYYRKGSAPVIIAKKVIQALLSIKYIPQKKGYLKCYTTWKGTLEGFLQYKKFKKYINSQVNK